MSKSHLLHHQCHIGNKYLSHAYLSSIQPCVGCLMTWNMCNCCGFGLFPSLGISLWYLWWNCKNISFNWYSLFVILVAYLKASSLSLVPLVICVMSLIFFKFIYIQWDKFELCAMLLSNNLVCICMTSFGYLVLFFSSHFICASFFVDVYLQWCVYLETYTYERGHPLVGILFLLSYLAFYL